MGFSDNLVGYFNQAKWSADHRLRIVRKQGEISELEKRIHWEKIELADIALRLHKQDGFGKKPVFVKKCDELDKLNKSLDKEKKELEEIKAEQYLRIPAAVPTVEKPLKKTMPKMPKTIPSKLEAFPVRPTKFIGLKAGLLGAVAFAILGAIIDFQFHPYFFSALIENVSGGMSDRNGLVSAGMPTFIITVGLMAIAGFAIGTMVDGIRKR